MVGGQVSGGRSSVLVRGQVSGVVGGQVSGERSSVVVRGQGIVERSS